MRSCPCKDWAIDSMGLIVSEVWRSRMEKSVLDLKRGITRGMTADIKEQQRTGSSEMQF